MLGVLADSSAFMVARGNAWPDLPLVTIGLVLGPPTVLAALELIPPTQTGRRYLHLAFRHPVDVATHRERWLPN